MIEVKPIFRDLSNPPELLKRCLHGNTQLSSGSVNKLILIRVRKNRFLPKNTLEFGAIEAIASFSNENSIKYDVLSSVGTQHGKRTVQAMKHFDKKKAFDEDNSIRKY